MLLDVYKERSSYRRKLLVGFVGKICLCDECGYKLKILLRDVRKIVVVSYGSGGWSNSWFGLKCPNCKENICVGIPSDKDLGNL